MNITTQKHSWVKEGLAICPVECGRVALHFLCEKYQKGNLVEAMKFLIDNGGHVKLKNSGGQTVLRSLYQNQHDQNIIDATKFLVDNGADLHG